MRFRQICGLTAISFLCGMAIAHPKKDGTAAISGIVRGAQGLSVALHLEPINGSPTRYYDGYEVTAESDGRFSFSGIQPGTYQLKGEANGLISATGHDGTTATITVRANETRRGVVIEMVPAPTICGRVTENGKPRQTWVTAFHYEPEYNVLSSTFLSRTNTDSNGNYRIASLAPGSYFLQAYMTWYPGSFSFNGAKPIIVGAGNTACPIDVPLQYTGGYATRVNGRIARVPGSENAEYCVNFLERNVAGISTPPLGASFTHPLSAGDSFTLSVLRGEYDAVLSDQHRIEQGFPTHKVIFDTQHLTVGESEVNGLVLTPHPMAAIAGDVNFEDITKRASCPGLGGQTVRILREGDGQFQSVVLGDKNHFEFQNVAPGDYKIFLGPYLREAVYVKSISVDGEPAKDRLVSIKEPRQVTVEVTLSGDVAHSAGHISPDVRSEPRWEVAWTRPKGSVSGEVVGDSDGGFTLKLHSARYNSNASGEYTVRADANGSFHFDSVDPGVYTLRAESETSVPYEYGAREAGERGTPIVVARGGHVKGLALAPTKLSAICGRVTDASGLPQKGMRIFIEAFEGSYLHGAKGIPELQTDADGRFRVEKLLPGDYFPGFPWGQHFVLFSADGSLSAATPIRLAAGKDAGCDAGPALDLRVPPGIDKLHTISGHVAGDLPPSIGDRFWVSLIWDVNVPDAQPYVASGKLDGEHNFRIEAAPNGRYLLQLHSAYGPEPMSWSGPYGPVSHLLATQALEVRDGDVQDVTITPMPLPTVAGTVHFTNLPADWKKFDVTAQRITLVPRVYAAPFSSQLAADGTFSIGPEDIGEYEVYFDFRHPLCVRSVRLNGHEIKGRFFHLGGAPSAHLDVDVSADCGELNATVVPDPSLPAAEPPVWETCQRQARPEHQLVLFPDPLFPSDADAGSSVEPRLLVGSRWGADDSKLRIAEVPPGHYRALTAEQFLPFVLGRLNDLSDEERKLWTAVAALGQPVTVQAGAKVEVVLPDKTIDVVRAAARLGVPLDTPLLDTRTASPMRY